MLHVCCGFKSIAGASCQCDCQALAAGLPASGWNSESLGILVMFLVALTYGTVQTSSCTPTQHRTYLNTRFTCLESIMLLNSKHIKEIVLLQNWTSFPHVTVSISSPTKSFFSLLNHCHLLQLGACLCKHGLICFLYAVLLKLKAFIFFFFYWGVCFTHLCSALLDDDLRCTYLFFGSLIFAM